MCAKEFEVIESPKVVNSCRNNCGICGAFPKSLLKTVCGHQFCNICIKDWIKHNHNSCPKCGFQFKTLEKSNNFTDFMVSESIVFRSFTETPISETRDKYKTYSPNIKIFYINRKSLTNGSVCNVCGFYIKNSFHDCFESLKRNPQKLKLTFNRIKAENFNLKEWSQQSEDESTSQWKVGYENSIKSLNQTNSLSIEKGRQRGLIINKLNDKICHYKGMVRDMTASKNHWKYKFKRQTTVIRHMKTNHMVVKRRLINQINKQKRKHFKQFTQFSKRFESIERKVFEIFKLNAKNLDLKHKFEILEDQCSDHCCDPIIIINTVLNNQQINEDNQQISKPKEPEVSHKECEQKLLNSENEVLTIESETQLNLELDEHGGEHGQHSIASETLPTLSNQNVLDTSLVRGIKRRRLTDEDLWSFQPTNIHELQSKESVSQKDMSLLTNETKSQKSIEELPSNEHFCVNKINNIKLMRHLYCDQKIQTLESLIKQQNNTIEELSNENNSKDELIKVLTKQFESQLPIELTPKRIQFRNYLLNNYKMILNTSRSNYNSEGSDTSFHILHNWIDKLWLCFDQSSHLMITKIDPTVIDSIEDIIQTSVHTNAYFNSEDSSETYLTIHFPHNSMKIWVRMALMLLLFNGKSVRNFNFQFINEREARLLLKRAHPLRAIDY